MNDKNEYNLDDLLREKPFAKLTEDERAYALGLCDSAGQYEAMRSAALISESALGGDGPALPRSLKANAMAAFDEKHHPAAKKKVIPFHVEKKSWHQYTLVRIGIAAALIGVIFLVLPFNETTHEQIAEKKSERIVSEKKIEQAESDSPAESDSSLSDENTNGAETTAADETQKETLADLQSLDEKPAETTIAAADLEISEPIMGLALEEEDEIALTELAAVTDSDGSQMDNANLGSRDMAKTSSAPQRMQPASADVMMQESVTITSRKKTDDSVSYQLSQQFGWQKHHYTAW